MITFYGGHLPHYVDFLAPIYHAMPADERGQFFAQGRAWKQAVKLGIDDAVALQPRKNLGPVVVASYEDYHRVRPSRVIMVNHGIGQTYNGCPDDRTAFRHRSYSGGVGRERIILNLCTSEQDAEINRHYYPNARSVAVGQAKMDKWHTPERRGVHWPDPKVVVISFHMDAHVCPETRWAYPHYEKTLIDLAKKQDELPYKLVGHWHPRAQWHLQQFWTQLGVQTCESFSDVLDSAALYVVDNSSTLYEFSSTGRPVVALSAPWYRRDVEHGLRYWSKIPGVHIEEPEDLADGIESALADPPEMQLHREEVIRDVYSGLNDGLATARTIDAIRSLA